MSPDTIQGSAALIGISLVATGTWREFGGGWSMIVVGTLLLAGVIYARTRTEAPEIPGEFDGGDV